jgi:hypothetical protein
VNTPAELHVRLQLLDKTKIKADYALSIPGWETSLAVCLMTY